MFASIAQLAARFGWGAQSSARKILDAADGAASGFSKDGVVSLDELDAALKAAANPELLTAQVIKQLQTTLGAKNSVSIKTLAPALAPLAILGDANRDGALSASELSVYIAGEQKTGAKGLPVLTEQRLAILRSQIAEAAGKTDYLSGTGPGTPIYRESYRALFDEEKRVPTWVSYTLSATDDAYRADVERKTTDDFRPDPEIASSADPKWYEKSGFDKGHQMPYEDYANPLAARDSFLMTNMAPQTPQLNEQSWKVLESAVRQLVNATGGTATVFTGNLFRSTPVQYIGPDKDNPSGKRKVAVPTDCFKAVLLTLPDGTQSMFAYVLPNRSDLPTKKDGVQTLLRASAVSVASLEAMSGCTFFAGAPASLKQNANGITPKGFRGMTANLKQGGKYEELGLLYGVKVARSASSPK
jgi:endonuclease G